jgi:hypothetical protein
VRFLDPVRERKRNGLWISRPGKAAHANIRAVQHQGGRIIGRHNF